MSNNKRASKRYDKPQPGKGKDKKEKCRECGSKRVELGFCMECGSTTEEEKKVNEYWI